MNTQLIEFLLETSLGQFMLAGEEGNLPLAKKSGLKLVFPLKSNDDERDRRRISEQEIRFLFVRVIDNAKDFDGYYAVEVPTVRKYRFKDIQPIVTGENKMDGYCSASIDVCLYNSKLERTNLIEFKAHNAPLKHIEKDILKLIKENGDNYFVHVLKNIDRGTLPVVIDKYKDSIRNVWSSDKCKNNCSRLTFYICVKSHSLIFKKSIALNRDSECAQVVQELDGKFERHDGDITIGDWEKIKYAP